ncbi:MAG TPA: CoA-binding protein [Dehalococcoidia bacterium]|nr:CoA-binding protein [Dehalococcoidia bacterium]
MKNVVARLERVLNPKVMAVVGDKRAGGGYMWLNNMKPFTGKLYSVQVDPKEIPGIEALGVKNYTSLLDIPEPVDLVVCAVPRQVSPRVIADCIKKQVGGVEMFTSGFAETGEELGIRLQDELTRTARDNDLLIVGPNCMGIYNPKVGVRFNAEQPAGVSGQIGFISQSGTHGMNFSLLAAANGMLMSKAISIGNSIVLDASDYLEYFAQDAETEAIAMYVEGVKDGPRFVRVLRETAAKKPVIVWKGGRTVAGGRATMSHTGSLASSQRVWDALVKQANAIPSRSLDETADLCQVLLRAKPSAGTRVGLMAMTGGQSVVFTDAFESEGMEVPLLTEKSYTELASFFNIVGGSYRNPFDMAGTIGGDQKNLDRLFRILDAEPNIDAIAMEISATFMSRRWANHPEQLDEFIDRLAAHKERSAKPYVTIMHPGHSELEVAQQRPRFQQAGLPVLPSFERAARAMSLCAEYHRTRAAIG